MPIQGDYPDCPCCGITTVCCPGLTIPNTLTLTIKDSCDGTTTLATITLTYNVSLLGWFGTWTWTPTKDGSCNPSEGCAERTYGLLFKCVGGEGAEFELGWNCDGNPATPMAGSYTPTTVVCTPALSASYLGITLTCFGEDFNCQEPYDAYVTE